MASRGGSRPKTSFPSCNSRCCPLALLANLLFKLGLIVTLGGRALTRRTLPGMLAIGLEIGAGLLLI